MALRMRGECVCLHVSVCVPETQLHSLARARSLALSCCLFARAHTRTHTQFSLSLFPFPPTPSPPFSSARALCLSRARSPFPPPSFTLPPSPRPLSLPLPVLLGWGLTLPSLGCLGEHPCLSFRLHHSLPSWAVLPRACRLLLSMVSWEEGSGEGRTPSSVPVVPSAASPLAP